MIPSNSGRTVRDTGILSENSYNTIFSAPPWERSMQQNLRLGANMMRYFQLFSLLLAVAGVITAVMTLKAEEHDAQQLFLKGSLVLFTLIALMLATSIWMLSRRNLAKRINILSATLDKVSAGDLTARVESSASDEMGQLGRNLNLMLDKFESLIISIGAITLELTHISAQNGEAAANVLDAAQIQSNGMEQTSSAVNGIISSVDMVSEGVITLSGSAEINSASISEISASISDVRKNI